ncbi:MAG: 50S ribosomal protein L23 [Candidatus Bathyarchaeia archaeon]
MDPLKTISHPMVTEDAVRLIESENKLVFIVDIKASRRDVAKAVEELYEVEVDKVNICITPEGRKKAYVKLSSEYKAADLAAKLGIL